MRCSKTLAIGTISAVVVGSGVAAGIIFGLKHKDIVEKLLQPFKGMVDESKRKIDTMSEDVAVKTAQLTKNPQINQDWVNNQWESIGY